MTVRQPELLAGRCRLPLDAASKDVFRKSAGVTTADCKGKASSTANVCGLWREFSRNSIGSPRTAL